MINIFSQYSLRTKLVLFYAILLIVSVVMVSFYSYRDIWQLLIDDKTSHLRARAKPIIEQWLIKQGLTTPEHIQSNFTPQVALELARDLTSRDAVAIILDLKGNVVANGRRLAEEPVAPAPTVQYFHKAIAGINEIAYLKKVNRKRLLIFLIPLRPQPGDPNIFGVVQMSTSVSDINGILFRHSSRQIAAVAIILILGIIFGYWLIGVSLKELQGLSISCQEIAKGNFAQRPSVKNQKGEIGRLADSFNLMIDKLEKLFDSQKQFVANAAHELLTPLTGLRGSLEVLLRGSQDDPEAVSRLSKGMYKEVNHLIRLCDQLLGLSRLENTSNISKKHIILSEFIDEFEQKIKHLTQIHSVIIQKGPSITLMADPDFLEQILFNLFSNAIRYSPPDATIIFGWELVTDHVRFWISDQGEGMDKETLSHVFEPFYRGKQQKYWGEKGSGLGLSLAKSMVEAHGGSIKIESTPGKGTTVFFTFPR